MEYDGDICICPQCGHQLPHQRGLPCFRVTCPQCGIPLQRLHGKRWNAPYPGQTDAILPILQKPPYVLKEECISCGICIDACHFNAVHFVNGKAAIDPANCTLCGECLTVCPRNAIRKR